MQSVLFYLLAIGALILVAGSIITVIALRNAPEGFENEEGFVGLTKGDEHLLGEFAQFRQQTILAAHSSQRQMAA